MKTPISSAGGNVATLASLALLFPFAPAAAEPPPYGASRDIGATEEVVAHVTPLCIKLGKGCGPGANALARSLAPRIAEDCIANVVVANDAGFVRLYTEAGVFEIPLPEDAAKRGNALARGEKGEPFDFYIQLPSQYTVPEDYVPRIPMKCYPGSSNWSFHARDTKAGKVNRHRGNAVRPTTWGETANYGSGGHSAKMLTRSSTYQKLNKVH